MPHSRNDGRRVAALDRSGLLSARSDETFQSLVGVAADAFGVPIATLSLIGADRQFYFEKVLDEFPITRLKIDRSFVRKMNDAPDVPVIRAILQPAKGFGLDVVAEGIETEDQLRRLRRKGCAEGQGYLFSPPVDPETFAARFLAGAVPVP